MNARLNGTGLGRATFMSFKSLPVRAVRAYRSTVRVSAIAAPLADQQASGGGDTPPPRSRPPSPMGGGGDYGDQGRKPSYDSAWVQNAGAVVAMFASCVAGVLVLVNLMLEPIRVQMASNSASISAQLASNSASISAQMDSISAQMDKLSTKLDEVAKEVNDLSREVARLQVKVDMKVDKK